jgi:hypothetical protein
MVLIKEYRIPLPVSMDEYKLAQRYCIAKRSEQETTGQEGVEMVRDECYDDYEGMGPGRFTEKILHLGRHVPGWAKRIIPTKAQMLIEKSWNSFPMCKSVYTSPFFEKFSMTIVSRHAPDAGTQDNILELDAQSLKRRVVEVMDIAYDQLDPKYYKKEEDPTLFRSEKLERGPLQRGWQEKVDPIMCCPKLVTIEFRYTGFQRKVETYMDAMLKLLMFTFSRQVFCLMDEWAGYSSQEIEDLERRTQEELNRRCGDLHVDTSRAEQVQLEECISPEEKRKGKNLKKQQS